MSKLQFSPVHDFTTIPFLPLNADKPAELRFQIKNTTDAPVAGQVELVNGQNVLWQEVVTIQPGTYFFHKLSATFPMGEHTLTFRWKAEDEADFCEEKLVLTADKANQPLLSGGFITLRSGFQDENRLQDQTTEQWASLVDDLNDMGAKMLVIFATLDKNNIADTESPVAANYPSNLFPRLDMACDAVDAIMRTAEKNGQQVLIGFAHPLTRTPDKVGAVMEELYSLYGKYASFYGWYSSYEVNMAREVPDEIWARWKGEWSKIKETSDRICPAKVTMTSPFCINLTNEQNTANMNATFIENLRTGQIPVDVLMPQDMNGHVTNFGPNRGYFPPSESAKMFQTLEPLCKEAGIHLWANCEAFDFTEDEKLLVPRYKNGGMQGKDGFLQQVIQSAPYVEKVLTYRLTSLFTGPKQAVKFGGEEARKQYDDYMAYREEYWK